MDAPGIHITKEQPIQVERSKALHELIKSHQHDDLVSVDYKAKQVKDELLCENCESDTEHYDQCVNLKKLKLTKMEWVTERADYSDSSSQYITSDNSVISVESRECDNNMPDCQNSFSDKCLSTILRLDREHNMFGLSNIAIVGKNVTNKIHKEDNKPAFPQTAIIQICCGGSCCKHKSNSDLPASLKCGGCRNYCINNTCCQVWPEKCGITYDDPPGPSVVSCAPSKCRLDSNTSYGMKISFKTKTKFDPSPNEVTPRSSCILKKPMAARSCHHLPQCAPPSACFPYLMPCYWPARAGAPCNNPSRCFHSPPCRAPRKIKSYIPPEEMCPTSGKCVNESKNAKCNNQACPGQCVRSTSLDSIFIDRRKKQKKKNTTLCECNFPICSGCFVHRPTGRNAKPDEIEHN